MDDILIVSSGQSQTAKLWVSYLNECFEHINQKRNRSPFRVLTVAVEDVLGADRVPSVVLETRMSRVKLQIVILCPQFLDHLYANPGPTLGRILQPDRVLAMLLGVDESGVSEQHRAALITYNQWKRLPVKDQDVSFVGNFVKVAMDILAKTCRQQNSHMEKAFFSVLPKKVKEDQNKVIVLLNDPIAREDRIKVFVDKNGERLDLTSVKRRNPYTLHFQMPESCLEVSMIVNVLVEKNDQPLGSRQIKCESRMRELDRILRSLDNPLEFTCQTLGFSPSSQEQLDNFFVTALQRNLPTHFNLLHGPAAHRRSQHSPEEYPTLLHFAARFGLERLAWQLLECPGGEQACEIRNACELTPAEMAERAGHTKLANALRGYMQMTEFTSMYSYLKIMSEGNTKTTEFSEAEYHHPRPLSETYQIPPSVPRPVMDNYQVPPAARPYNPAPEKEFGGYMEMHPSPVGQNGRRTTALHTKHVPDFLNLTSTAEDLPRRSPSPVLTSHSSTSTSRHNLDQIDIDSTGSKDSRIQHLGSALLVKQSREHFVNKEQDELVEIITDFKNNVFTISEVEKLVESWKNRNDVRQSFKDKQEQLNQMREEYERLQEQMQEQMKRPTPFERIRNLFKVKPKETKENGADGTAEGTGNSVKNDPTENIPLCHRPVSSLSLHSTCSSSSSGRMSTVSACSGVSLGDSGTHSDPEDRKILSSLETIRLGRGICNYEVPPAPRPVQFPFKLGPPPIATLHHGIEDRPPQPVPRGDCSPTTPPVSADSVVSYDSYGYLILETADQVNSDSLNAEGDYEQMNIGSSLNTVAEEPDATTGNSTRTENPQAKATASLNSDSSDSTSDLPDYMNIVFPETGKTHRPPIPPRVPSLHK